MERMSATKAEAAEAPEVATKAEAPEAPEAARRTAEPLSAARVEQMADAFASMDIAEAQKVADASAPPLPKITPAAPYSHYLNIHPLLDGRMY